ncbi:FixH family protein [Psychrobacillus vulpis]|uniref:FixH family protein n=1 Tax=Psychrobacillus vulpis TaxID=2325572 RepID=A0A544TNM4_9BACI|nr:FixH family protein [Psychrobacillus vulpis]TQR19035.1 FixH family protein [Psychrobacillus vulpis]
MKKVLTVIALTTLALVGCSNNEATTNGGSHNEGTLEEIVVVIQTPETLPVGEDIKLSAKVTQGDKVVDDADKVEFEVWESGMREHGTMLDGKLTKDGVYEVNYTFDHDGIYYMFAHTTARGLHVMPKQELKVGNPDMSKVMPDDSDNSMGEGHKH